MKIAIIGPGAVGRLLAYVLHQGGHVPLLVCRREEQRAALEREGLTCVDPEGAAHSVPVQAVLGNESLPTDVDGAVITVKSQDTRAAGALLQGGRDIPVLSLQNGLGNGETLTELVPPSRLAVGLTTHGATAEGEVRVLYKGRGSTVIGDWLGRNPFRVGDKDRLPAGTPHAQSVSRELSMNPPSPESAAFWWKSLLDACGHAVTLSSDIRTEVWRKAMVNIGINPFTALLGVPNGALLEAPELLPLIAATVEEAQQVARAEGVFLTDGYERVLEVCRLTAQNHSSMLQDIRKRRKTEISAMCGVIVEVGERHGLLVPYNRRILDLIAELEATHRHLTQAELQNGLRNAN